MNVGSTVNGLTVFELKGSIKMKKLTRILIVLLAVTMVSVSNYPSAYSLSDKEKNNNNEEVPAIEISINGSKPLTVPVISQEKSAVVPVAGAQASAVKVVSRIDGRSIRFEVFAVLDPLPTPLSCDSMKQLRSERVSSYTGEFGKTVRVSDLEKFGVAPFNVKVLKMNATQLCPAGCCCCLPGGPTCCPRRGQCLDCGSCGLCCL